VTVGAFIARYGVPLLLAVASAAGVAFLLLRDLGRRDTDAKAKARTDLVLGTPGEHRSRFGLRGPSPKPGEGPEKPHDREDER
jgi:hypothetical protein